MVTKPRIIQPNNYYHVYNRSANKLTIFHNDKDYDRWQNKVIDIKEKTKITIVAWTILPNHYHFLLKEPSLKTIEGCKFKGSIESSISQFISRLENAYTKYFNCRHGHVGIIFQGPYKSIPINQDDYLEQLMNYIHTNAVKHKIVDNINDWPYTSYHQPSGLTQPSGLGRMKR
jgi:REP element-mobilizing transposase RayT